MATTVTATETNSSTATRTVPMPSNGRPWSPRIEQDATWANGTGAGQVDEVWMGEGTVAAGAFVNLDLKALAQVDDDSVAIRTIDFASIKKITVKNITAGATGYLTIGGGTGAASAADAWAGADTPFLTDATINALQTPNSATNDRAVFKWTSQTGGTVTNTSKDILCLGGVTATQTYQIHITGVSS